jgi:hypothetical protein
MQVVNLRESRFDSLVQNGGVVALWRQMVTLKFVDQTAGRTVTSGEHSVVSFCIPAQERSQPLNRPLDGCS